MKIYALLKHLLIVQDYDIRRLEIEKSARDLRQEYQKIKANYQKTLDYRESIEASLKQKRAENRQIEGELEALAAKRIELAEKSVKVKNNTHAEALEKELAANDLQRDALENQQIAVLYDVEQLEKELDELSLTCNQAKLDFEKQVDYLKKRQEAIKEAYADGTRKRDTLLQQLDPKVVELYQQTVKSVGKPPYIVPMKGDSCGGCHMRFPAGTKEEALANLEHIQTCPFCRRMLYLPEEDIPNAAEK